MFKWKKNEYIQDTGLIKFESEKARDVFPYEDRPWTKCPIKKHTTSAESHLLYKLAKESGPGTYADVGSLNGGSVCTIGHGVEDAGGGKVYCVDYFGTGSEEYRGDPDAPDRIISYFRDNFIKTVTDPLIGTSKYWGKRIKDELNGVFIDADHTYKSVKEDFELWGSKVQPGGWVAFHDRQFVEVHQFLRELDSNKNWKHEKTVFTIEVFRRK